MDAAKLDKARRDRIANHALTLFESTEAAAFAVNAAQSPEFEPEDLDSLHSSDRWQCRAVLVLAALEAERDQEALLYYIDLLWDIHENWAQGIAHAKPIVEKSDTRRRMNRGSARKPRLDAIGRFLRESLKALGGDANPRGLRRNAEARGASITETKKGQKKV